jgi:type IV pilus assembly protein PilE
MALVSCPDCGAQVSDVAVVCAQCGFPLRRDALDRAAGARRGGSGRNTTGIIVGVAAAGCLVFVVLGILAALAIPRFTAASGRAKEKEGELLLKQVFTLENAYYANNGAYTADLEALKTVGWEDGPTLYYTVEIRLDGPAATLACLEARPKRGADVQPLSMDSAGVIYRDQGCTGETLSRSRSSAHDEGRVDFV